MTMTARAVTVRADDLQAVVRCAVDQVDDPTIAPALARLLWALLDPSGGPAAPAAPPWVDPYAHRAPPCMHDVCPTPNLCTCEGLCMERVHFEAKHPEERQKRLQAEREPEGGRRLYELPKAEAEPEPDLSEAKAEWERYESEVAGQLVELEKLKHPKVRKHHLLSLDCTLARMEALFPAAGLPYGAGIMRRIERTKGLRKLWLEAAGPAATEMHDRLRGEAPEPGPCPASPAPPAEPPATVELQLGGSTTAAELVKGPTQRAVLDAVLGGATTVAGVMEKTGLDRKAVDNASYALQRKGLLEREPQGHLVETVEQYEKRGGKITKLPASGSPEFRERFRSEADREGNW